jgi:predicted  nucleic acid-binding Zn-ribbon protein
MSKKIHFLLTLQHYEQRLETIDLKKYTSRLLHLQKSQQDLTEHLDQVHHDLLREQQHIKASEHELCTLEENLRQCLGQQASSKKAEAFQALGAKITHIREQIASCEERIFRHLEIQESKQKAFAGIVKETEDKKKKLQEEMIKQQKVFAGCEQNITSLQEKIKIFRENIVDRELLQRYDHVKSKGVHFPWITSVKNHRCQGCHIRLSPEQDDFFRQNPEAQDYCEQCGRLLYVPASTIEDEETNEC